MSEPMTNQELTDALRSVIDVALALAACHHTHNPFNGNPERPSAEVPISPTTVRIVSSLAPNDPRMEALIALKARLLESEVRP